MVPKLRFSKIAQSRGFETITRHFFRHNLQKTSDMKKFNGFLKPKDFILFRIKYIPNVCNPMEMFASTGFNMINLYEMVFRGMVLMIMINRVMLLIRIKALDIQSMLFSPHCYGIRIYFCAKIYENLMTYSRVPNNRVVFTIYFGIFSNIFIK